MAPPKIGDNPSYYKTTTQTTENFEDILEHGFQGPPGPSLSGAVFITDVESLDGGIIGEKFYVSGTVPENIVLDSITTNADALRVHVIIIGGYDVYTPSASVNDSPVVGIVESSTKRYYTGYADILVTEDADVVAALQSGVAHSIRVIHKPDVGPVVDDIYFGTYPGNQTELKLDDQVPVELRVTNDADKVYILDTEAFHYVEAILEGDNTGGIGYKRARCTITAKEVDGEYFVYAQAINSSSVQGKIRKSDATLKLSQLKPTVNSVTFDYGMHRKGAGLGDTIGIIADVSNYDQISYYSPALNISQPLIFEQSKSARIISTNNNILTLTLIREANNSVVEYTKRINVITAEASAVVHFDVPSDKLELTGLTTIIDLQVIPNQDLLSDPYIVLNIGRVVITGYDETNGAYNGYVEITPDSPQGAVSVIQSELEGSTGSLSSNVTLDKAYYVYGYAYFKFSVSPKSNMVKLPYDVTKDYKVSLFDYDLEYRLSTDPHDLGYTIVDDQNNPAGTGSIIYFTDPALKYANISGTLKGMVTSPSAGVQQ